MKIFKRVISVVALLILIGVSGSYIYVRHIARRGLPDYNLETRLEGLSGEVTVYRDSYGIPHIYAKSEADLYRATGFVMAQDRLWQMDLIRRATTGRLAEIFGPDLVKTDRLMRSLRLKEKSRMVHENMDSVILEQMDQFAAGVNQYLELKGDNLPPEFSLLGYRPERWHSEDAINLVSYMAWDLTMAWAFEPFYHKLLTKDDSAITPEMVEELYPDLSLQNSVVYPGFENDSESGELLEETVTAMVDSTSYLSELGLSIYSSSNSWAVSGEKSATGMPLFANDMHLYLFAPGIWYQCHQVVEGKLDVTGLLLPGAPFVVAGHNEEIAWGMTNVMVDDMDFYLETLNPDNPDQYLFNGEWRNLTITKEEIKIKGGGSETVEFRFTHRGPLLSKFKTKKNRAVSMRWVGNEMSNEIRSLYLLNRASDWEQFKDAVSSFRSLSQNIIYADRQGNIGLYCSAAIPIRKGAGHAVLPGETDEYDWQGLIPFEELPHTYNPPGGIITSANNKTVDDSYPYYISRWYALSYRNDRIKELLNEKDKLTIDDYRRIQADSKSGFASQWLDELLLLLTPETNETESLYLEGYKLLSEWDGVLERDSGGAALFMQFYRELLENVYADEMGEESFDEYLQYYYLGQYAMQKLWLNRESAWCDNIKTTDRVEKFDELLVDSFRSALTVLKESQGGKVERWRWGKIHRLTLNHPMGEVKLLDTLFRFNREPVEVNAGMDTVCDFAFNQAQGFDAIYGASHRHIYSLADWDSSLTVLPTGVSGIPASPHYCDQTAIYSEHDYRIDFFSPEKVEAGAVYEMKLTP